MNTSVPYIAHEGELARMERINKRFAFLMLALVVIDAAGCMFLMRRR